MYRSTSSAPITSARFVQIIVQGPDFLGEREPIMAGGGKPELWKPGAGLNPSGQSGPAYNSVWTIICCVIIEVHVKFFLMFSAMPCLIV